MTEAALRWRPGGPGRERRSVAEVSDPDGCDELAWEVPSPDGCDEVRARVAGEASAVRTIRRHLVGQCGQDRKDVALIGYWRLGRAEVLPRTHVADVAVIGFTDDKRREMSALMDAMTERSPR